MKDSTKILLVIVLSMAVLVYSSVYAVLFVRSFADDAQVVNMAGVIRGSVQRVVKLELAGQSSGAVVAEIDDLLAEFLREEFTIEADGQGDFAARIRDLHSGWSRLKQVLDQYRDDPSAASLHLVNRISEEMWTAANDTVFLAQYTSEAKVSNFRLLLFALAAALVLLVALFFLTNQKVRNKLEVMATRDSLTGALTRAFFEEYLVREVERVRRYGTELSMIMLDIDHFKRVNDTYGHDAGDVVLHELGEVISQVIRRADILARIGGEEFAIIVPETDLADAAVLAEKIRQAVCNHRFGKVGDITISIGVAQFRSHDTENSLLKKADRALYQAKNGGRNRVVTVRK